MTNKTLEIEIEQRLGEHAIRLTQARRRTLLALAVADGPRSAAELHEDLDRAIPLSTLYRSLAVLEKTGVLVPHLGQRGVARYELAEWLQGHHHHLVCIQCGAVDDISLPDPYEARVAELVASIGSIGGFKPLNHTLEIEGRCARCL
jgi:Fur family ferric uptake transcriptional regulator